MILLRGEGICERDKEREKQEEGWKTGRGTVIERHVEKEGEWGRVMTKGTGREAEEEWGTGRIPLNRHVFNGDAEKEKRDETGIWTSCKYSGKFT